jgi:hypothetical protein
MVAAEERLQHHAGRPHPLRLARRTPAPERGGALVAEEVLEDDAEEGRQRRAPLVPAQDGIVVLHERQPRCRDEILSVRPLDTGTMAYAARYAVDDPQVRAEQLCHIHKL